MTSIKYGETGARAVSQAYGQSNRDLFGDGSDGALVFDGTSTVLGLVPSATVYTLTRDIFASSIKVNASTTIKAAGFRIFCAGALVVAATGVISNNGNAGALNVAGAITNSSASTAVGTAGGAGRAGSSGVGVAGTANAFGFPGGAGVGGAGGGDGTNVGGAAGAWTALGAVTGGPRLAGELIRGIVFGTGSSGTAALVSAWGGGSGGGGGACDSADATGGGGGGGGGGTVVTICVDSSGSGTVTAAGGAGGAKVGAAGVAGTAGHAGNVIQVTL